MTWTWRLESADGSTVATPNGLSVPSQPTQSDAETWLGECWQSLNDAGVAQVSLLNEGAVVYGPMKLTV